MKRNSKIIIEDMTKSEVNSIVQSKIDNFVKSKEMEKKVKELASDVVSELFKVLWQRNNMWKSTISK